MTEEEFRTGKLADGSLLMQPEQPEIPLIPFDKAQAIGKRLHDRWEDMTGQAPLAEDDMAWGDIVQFIIRCARDSQP